MNSAALTDDDRRDLVAYLDGELPPDEAARVEARMLADEAFRAEMQALQGTFDMLEDLPVSTVGPDFTRTTVEVAAFDARRRPSAVGIDGRRLLTAGLIFVAAFVAAAFGFAWQRNRQLLPEREAIRDFPVVQNSVIYQKAHDVAFLRLLRENALFDPAAADFASGEVGGTAASAAVDTGSDLVAIGSLTPEQIQSRIDALSTADREDLVGKMERYEKSPGSEQQKLREIHEELLADPEGVELFRVARRFTDWSTTLPPESQTELEKLAGDPQARLAKVQELMKSEEAREFLRLVSVKVSEEDHQAIVTWLRAYVEENQARFKEPLPERTWGWLRSLDDDERWIWTLVAYRRNSDGPEALPMPRPSDEELAKLSSSLGGEAKKAFDQAGDPERKLRLLDEWMKAAVVARMVPQIDKEKLAAFHRDRLTPAVRAELDKLPPDELHRRLQFIYLYHEPRLGEGEKLDVDQLRNFLSERPNFPLPPMRRDGFGQGRGPFFPPLPGPSPDGSRSPDGPPPRPPGDFRSQEEGPRTKDHRRDGESQDRDR